MKAKVIKRFKDKYAGGLYTPGDLFEGETARVEYLINLGYLEKPKTKTTKKK
jgi:hypothetical protein